MPELGIAQVADVTHLDRLGLPVFTASRPLGKASALHFGKGLSRAAARVSALMEAVEFAAAESTSMREADGRLRWSDLFARMPGPLQFADFCPRIGMSLSKDDSTYVVLCELLGSAKRVLLPAELVFVPCVDKSGGPARFGWSTNGLASGSTLQEATLYAVLEVLERDSVAMNLALDRSHLIDNAELPTPFDRKARDWRRKGLSLVVRLVPNDFGLSCFEAAIFDPSNKDLAVACGWGFHFDRSVALSQAVCEAAQSRLGAICTSGGRATGDAQADGEVRASNVDALERTFTRWTDAARCANFSQAPQVIVRSVRAGLAELQERMAAVGLPHVFRRRMFADGGALALQGLHVVKVVVPWCETITGSHARAGPRLLARILERAAQARAQPGDESSHARSNTSAVGMADP